MVRKAKISVYSHKEFKNVHMFKVRENVERKPGKKLEYESDSKYEMDVVHEGGSEFCERCSGSSKEYLDEVKRSLMDYWGMTGSVDGISMLCEGCTEIELEDFKSFDEDGYDGYDGEFDDDL